MTKPRTAAHLAAGGVATLLFASAGHLAPGQPVWWWNLAAAAGGIGTFAISAAVQHVADRLGDPEPRPQLPAPRTETRTASRELTR